MCRRRIKLDLQMDKTHKDSLGTNYCAESLIIDELWPLVELVVIMKIDMLPRNTGNLF